jgi:hypothetical protein
MTADQITFELSGGAANSDPTLSFGGEKSGTPIEELQSTVTTNQGPDRSIFFDSARIGDGDGTHADKWILFITGPNALSAGRVRDFRSADGRFQLEGRMPSTGVIGNIYRLFDLNSLFHEVTAEQCALGHTDFRMVYVRNTSGDFASKYQCYLRAHGDGPSWAGVDFEIFSKEDQNPLEGTPADEETPPAGLDAIENFSRTTAYYGFPSPQPFRARTHAQNFAGGTWKAVYLKRIVPLNQRRQPFAVCMIVVEMRDAGSTLVSCGCLMPFGLLGFTPEIALSRDRGPIRTEQQIADGYDSAIRVGHGARFTAEVRSQETGLVVPDLEVGWTLDGPGQLWTPPGPLTDSNGIAKATYSAPSEATATRQTITAGNVSSKAFGKSDTSGGPNAHTVAAGADRILCCYVHAGTDVDGPADLTPYGGSVCTYDDDPMTLAARAFSFSGLLIDLFYLLDPPVGSHLLEFSLPGVAVGILMQGVDFSGVDQVSPLDVAPSVFVEDDAASTEIIHPFTTVTDGAMLWGTAGNGHPIDPTMNNGAGQTQTGGATGGDVPHETARLKAGYKLLGAAGADQLRWFNIAAGGDHLGVAVALRAALTPATLTAKV